MEYKLDHIHFRCSNLEESIAYYQDMFGAQELERVDAAGKIIVKLEIPGTILSLSPAPEDSDAAQEDSTTRLGGYELGFQVPDLDGASSAQIRFRLETDVWVTEDGWYVDDITVRAAEPGAIGNVFDDGFESGDLTVWSLSVP